MHVHGKQGIKCVRKFYELKVLHSPPIYIILLIKVYYIYRAFGHNFFYTEKYLIST